MRYLPGMPDVEGAVCHPAYNRAGCRTPMQWDDGPNAGFSTADPERLYLPIDPDPARPTVSAQDGDPGSTLALVRELIRLRRETPVLQGRAATTVLHESYPLAYRRGESHLVVVNPRGTSASLSVPGLTDAAVVWGRGVHVRGDRLEVDAFGHAVLELGS